MKLLSIVLFFATSSAIAASHISGQLSSSGDLVIVIIDDPSSRPFEAGLLWATITGENSVKKVRGSGFMLNCYANPSNTLNLAAEPMGSCRLILRSEVLIRQDGHLGALITDPTVRANFVESKLSMASEKLHWVSSPAREILSVKMNESLLSTRALSKR